MGDKSNIEWTDATWSTITGCTRVSEGCRFCYSERLSATRLKHLDKYQGVAELRADGEARWTGRINFDESALSIPLRWKKPRRIFVNSMSDLFHEDVIWDFVDKVFAVMYDAQWHTFQVLTKRPARMAEYLSSGGVQNRIAHKAWWRLRQTNSEKAALVSPEDIRDDIAASWPLSNVWLGTSVEDQQRADARIPLLLQTPAAVRFLSVEPLLGPVDLHLSKSGYHHVDDFPAAPLPRDGPRSAQKPPAISWVIVGGESGPHARPCDLAWIRSIRDQCNAAGVACFVKQLGARITIPNYSFGEWPRDGDGLRHETPTVPMQGEPIDVRTDDGKGGDWDEWPNDLRVRQFPQPHGAPA